MSKDGTLGDSQGTGIMLRRKKRDDSSPSKAGDALAIADMVQKLCQVQTHTLPIPRKGFQNTAVSDCEFSHDRQQGSLYTHPSPGHTL